jgi:hypothetical protein
MLQDVESLERIADAKPVDNVDQALSDEVLCFFLRGEASNNKQRPAKGDVEGFLLQDAGQRAFCVQNCVTHEALIRTLWILVLVLGVW